MEESGRIPILLCIMTCSIVATRKHRPNYSIKEYLNKLKIIHDNVLQYPQDPNVEDNLNLSYDKSLFACVKIAVELLRESESVYATLARHVFENSAYFSPNEIPIGYFLKHISIVRTSIKDVKRNLILELKSKEILIEAFQLLSKFSLVKYEQEIYSEHGVNISMHRLVQKVSRILLSNSENRIINNLLQDMPTSHGNEHDEAFFEAYKVATIWSHVTKHQELINVHKSKLSFKKLASFGFWKEIEDIVELLKKFNEGVFAKKKLMEFEYHHMFHKENALVLALRNNRKFANWLIQILKNDEVYFNENYTQDDFNDDLYRTLTCVIELMDLSTVKLLLDAFQFDVNYHKNDNDDSLLNTAISCGRMETAKYLLFDKKSNPTIRGYGGQTSLHWMACRWGISKIETKGDTEASQLHITTSQLVEILATEVLREYPDLLKEEDDNGNYPFMTAASCGYVEALTFLLERDNSNVNKTDSNGRTALQLVIERFEYTGISAVHILMQHSADLHFWDVETGNAWHLIFRNINSDFDEEMDREFFELLKLLIEKGVDETVKDKDGNTFFHYLMTRSYFTWRKPEFAVKVLEFLDENNLLRIIEEVNNNG